MSIRSLTLQFILYQCISHCAFFFPYKPYLIPALQRHIKAPEKLPHNQLNLSNAHADMGHSHGQADQDPHALDLESVHEEPGDVQHERRADTERRHTLGRELRQGDPQVRQAQPDPQRGLPSERHGGRVEHRGLGPQDVSSVENGAGAGPDERHILAGQQYHLRRVAGPGERGRVALRHVVQDTRRT